MRPRRICGSATAADRWCDSWRRAGQQEDVLLLLAATASAAIPGISAAGATPAARRLTAAADAELLLLGPAAHRPHALPPLPAGVSPALISHVVARDLALAPLIVDLGCPAAPAVPHLRLPGRCGAGPAGCLSSGAAMDGARIAALLERGRRWGGRPGPGEDARALLLAECVPGGTSTALAVLLGLGVAAEGLVSGSLRRPAHGLKTALAWQGLKAAGLEPSRGSTADRARAVLAAVGDPMQPLAAGLTRAAAAAGRPVLLAGGSQMAAVLAVALALATPAERQRISERVAIGTTAWVAGETGSDLPLLLQRIGERFGVGLLAFAADLRFDRVSHPWLAAYERGYVKEGVGAGGLALLWQLRQRSPQALARACERACLRLEAMAGWDQPAGPAAAGHAVAVRRQETP